MQLGRGHKLSVWLVEELGLGILFSPKIWDYSEMGAEKLDLGLGESKYPLLDLRPQSVTGSESIPRFFEVLVGWRQRRRANASRKNWPNRKRWSKQIKKKKDKVRNKELIESLSVL